MSLFDGFEGNEGDVYLLLIDEANLCLGDFVDAVDLPGSLRLIGECVEAFENWRLARVKYHNTGASVLLSYEGRREAREIAKRHPLLAAKVAHWVKETYGDSRRDQAGPTFRETYHEIRERDYAAVAAKTRALGAMNHNRHVLASLVGARADQLKKVEIDNMRGYYANPLYGSL